MFEILLSMGMKFNSWFVLQTYDWYTSKMYLELDSRNILWLLKYCYKELFIYLSFLIYMESKKLNYKWKLTLKACCTF